MSCEPQPWNSEVYETRHTACLCKSCEDKTAILKAHAGEEDTVRDMAEEAMRDSGMMPQQPHSDTYMLEAFRQIENKTTDLLALLLSLAITVPDAATSCHFISDGVQFIRRRAKEAQEPLVIADPPDNGIFTSPGEMAGNPSCNDINEHATRRL